MLCPLLLGLLLSALLFLYIRFPFLPQDCAFALRTLNLGRLLARFGSRSPCFSTLDRFAEVARKHPDKLFIVFGDERYTYRDADRISNRLANALRDRSGQIVALFHGNAPMYVFTWLALAKLGCTVALLNTNIRSRSLVHCCECSGAKTLITAAELVPAVLEVLPSLRQQQVSVLMLSGEAETHGIINLTNQVSCASEEAPPISLRQHITMKSPALYIYTSGTTGLPKAAVVTHEKVWMMSFLQRLSGVCSSDIIYICLPLYHSAGFLAGLSGAIERGITVVLKSKFSASRFWDDCREHNVTVIQYIGEVMRYLCNTPERENDRQHSVRLALGNGIRAETWREFLRRFGDVRVCECYGATEGNIGFFNYTGKIGSIGRVSAIHKLLFPYAFLKFDPEKEEPVRGSDGLCVEAAPGETGLLVAKIHKLAPFEGYAKNSTQTEKKRLRDVFQRGDMYFNTGDLILADRQGFLFFQDRIGDTFRWKGENVATTEVSEILLMLDFIEAANVYGVTVPGHEGRVGMAALQLTDGMEFDGSAAYEHMKNLLPAYARPRFIRIQEELRLTGTFKQVKVQLVQEGFDPNSTRDRLFIMEENQQTFVPLTEEIFSAITAGRTRL
ncbi:solute carrier family 27 member 2a [Danio rerio]|uniref:long-chain-fatty-acid--CoA ligase n=1 Tax=Danio rerio TaxID=7955 RepID=Q4KMC7_DANRE|nr:solute carrier family 27 member 2a [Danio rerio]AAH98625.1 Solute carrier family 27 (fatty acid transporter), member 2 [Danio rerio]|eukprot:NP_001020470.1 solute carrier family 27 member 2a [Danio rerio]